MNTLLYCAVLVGPETEVMERELSDAVKMRGIPHMCVVLMTGGFGDVASAEAVNGLPVSFVCVSSVSGFGCLNGIEKLSLFDLVSVPRRYNSSAPQA